MALQGAGRIVVGGWTSATAMGRDLLAVRLTETGSNNNSFGTGGSFTSTFLATAPVWMTKPMASSRSADLGLLPTTTIQSRLILAGASCLENQGVADDWDLLLVRLNEDGTWIRH